MKRFRDNSYLFSQNAPFVEELYAQYLKKPTSVPDDWRQFFEQLRVNGESFTPDFNHRQIQQEFSRRSRESRHPVGRHASPLSPAALNKQVQVLQFINAHRFRGHQIADLDPLQMQIRPHIPELDLNYHQLSEDDLDTVFNTGSLAGPRQATLREIIDTVRETYCGHLGVEYMHITDTEEKRWIQQRLESMRGKPDFSENKKLQILQRLVAAGEFEKYLHTRYVGQKRFSLEGAESVIPMLDELIQRAGEHEVTEIVLGMAHRGRLNVLTNILGKAPSSLFQEFEGIADPNGSASGDVKYHQGFSTDIETAGGIVHLALAFNPSHLEIISPVVQGSVRARQQRRADKQGDLVIPVLIHGDAAFAGQGVVMETFQMSEARGYTTGGTVHIIINNQIGFTTSNPLDARSTVYCTEVARMVQAPIFHVNGDDPEAVLFVTQLALDYRMKFHNDVVIDLVCYRRYGHSEADEPAATQPVMYAKIKKHARVSEIYLESMCNAGICPIDETRHLAQQYQDTLEAGEFVAPHIVTEAFEKPFWVDWSPHFSAQLTEDVDTTVSRELVAQVMQKLCDIPDTISVHSQVERILESRLRMAADEESMDWGFAETLAYASLLLAGHPVRMSGQDCGRGTFFHRHAIVHDQIDGHYYTPLQNLSPDQQEFTIYDSLLSEEAVLGFEYGFSTAAPYALTIWEAQFGDFANGAQVVIDQFISSSESKWGRLSGLVMLLPHGFDGQGPEHSSARLERYLQLCAEDNMQVCVPTTPAQMFHLLRRQVLRQARKPLIVMSPKSLLRHKLSVSTLEDICDKRFMPVIADTGDLVPGKVNRILVCSGKVYFDLLDAREERGLDNIALIRIEELYPFPRQLLAVQLAHYPNATDVVWCQEEPLNQGGWQFVRPYLAGQVTAKQTLSVVARPASASPAVGYYQKHIQQLQILVNEAMGQSQSQENVSDMAYREMQ
ncbi:MAG: 2-oxoglutarate dehydrogenase [Gammaproteobacteria bacterium SG8_15]|nr:MAG: 2-oxoglutarate dehydrogenase [Gammaproteobacteria bacterium SG8_15]